MSKTKIASPPLAEMVKDPDLVDRIFDYVVALLPELSSREAEIKRAVREEFAGQSIYVNRRGERHELARRVLAMFNGRNASEVSRSLKISRATVYRLIKQPGLSTKEKEPT